jgi:ketosteroid isomerase-like protein
MNSMSSDRTPLAIFILLASCTQRNAIPAAHKSDPQIEAEILATFDSLTTAIRELKVERMLTFYSTDSSIVRVLDGRLISGRRAVERDFREGFAVVRSIDRLELLARHAAVLSPQAAVLTAELAEAFTDTSGRGAAVRAAWTSAWQLQAGHWRIVQDAAVHVPLKP